MTNEQKAIVGSDEQPFTIHLLNTYQNYMLPTLSNMGMSSEGLRKMSRGMHDLVVKELASEGISYEGLRSALTPQRSNKEAAFIFDSRPAGGMYGYEISKFWLPVLKKHGPDKTAILHGDMMGVPAEFVHAGFEKHLVGPENFSRTSPEIYYVVYFTNLSKPQLAKMDEMFQETDAPYLGYVDCSAWNPLKLAMPLPQFGLRVKNTIVTAEWEEDANPLGYPVEDYGFKILGIEQTLYDALLHYRLDRGIPQWAADDAAMSLNVLKGKQESIQDLGVFINASRLDYLIRDHKQSLESAGWGDLNPDAIAASIKEKIDRGLIYNLRFTEGSRGGVPAPELNTYQFTVVLNFPDTQGIVRQYSVGMKYSAEDHMAEVTTLI